jgi:hypothetical protein
MTPLEEAILRAHEAGNYQLLRELQRQYRAAAVSESASRGIPGTARVIEPKARPAVLSPARAPATHKEWPPWRLHDTAQARAATTGPLSIQVSSSAEATMGDRAWDKRHDLICGTEAAAGILYGQGTSVLYAGTAGSSGSDGAVEIDFSAARQEERRFGAGLIGDWHAHPAKPTPSLEDLAGWRDAARVRGAAHVGIILTPGAASDWSEPRMSAWLTFRRGGGRYISEPATIEGGKRA